MSPYRTQHCSRATVRGKEKGKERLLGRRKQRGAITICTAITAAVITTSRGTVIEREEEKQGRHHGTKLKRQLKPMQQRRQMTKHL